jgi:hypothetical protein
MVNHPAWWQGNAPDNLSNVYMEVTTQGLYANIELTFTMHGNAFVTGSDSLQGVLSFELPPNSYIHGSWLWLDETTIIEADLKERGQAFEIYSSYVQVRRDPSFLVKNGNNLYQINVFPILNNYPRKVKLIISTLMDQRGDKALLTLPTNILAASNVKPGFMMTVNAGNGYTMPSFSEVNFNNYIVNNVGNTYLLDMPSGSYGIGKELTLVFNTPDVPSLSVFQTGVNQGVYELKIPAANNNMPPRCFNFIIDYPESTTQTAIYQLDEIKKYLRSFLLHDLRPVDSFNVFYTNINGNVIKVFPSWIAALPYNVNNMLDNFLTDANTVNTAQLYTEGILHGQTKSPDEEQTIIITRDFAHNSVQSANAIIGQVADSVGTFTNKVHIINFGCMALSNNPGSTALFVGLANATGGTYYKHNGAIQDFYTEKYTYDLDIRSILRGIAMNGQGTNVYEVNIPVSNGLVYNTYDLSGTGMYSPSFPYIETGKFYGTISAGDVTVEYLSQGNYLQHQSAIAAVDPGTMHQYRNWANSYILDLEGSNNPQVQAEILATSIANDVLCYETAFLALENGDTVQTDTIVKYIITELTAELATESNIKCYPNPFTASLTIESPDDIEFLEILDITGRIVLSRQDLKTRSFTWNAQDNNGVSLTEGIYFIRLKHNGKTEMIKVSKL